MPTLRTYQRKVLCKKYIDDPMMNYFTLHIKDTVIRDKMLIWQRNLFQKLFWPVTVFCLIGLFVNGLSYHSGDGSLFMIVISAVLVLNQGLWATLKCVWPSQTVKLTLSYCLIYEVLTPLLLFNVLGEEALHAEDRAIYDSLITVNFLLANLI